MLVQCKKTGQWYNPQTQFLKRMQTKEIMEVFKRLANK